jgi:hypothetical protein
LALESSGVRIPYSEGKSIKGRCPFADVYHLTVDADLSMRVYSDTNSAYCFAGCGSLTPVFIYAKLNDLSYSKAAWSLLGFVGYKPKNLTEQWRELVSYSEPFDKLSYRQAFIEYCNFTFDNWAELQYKGSVAGAVSKLFSVLEVVNTMDDANTWLSVSKAKIRVKVENEFSS